MADFLENIFGAAKEGLQAVGNAGLDMGKAVANIPVSILTALPDFTKDPDVFLGGGREQAIASLLSRDYRKQQKQQMDAARTWDQMTKTKEAVDWVQGLFGGLATDTAQGEQRKLLEAQGFDPAMLQPLAEAAKAERHAARKGATAAGMAPAIANIADIKSARQGGQSEFADRLAREQNVQQAELTRGTQTHQFGLSKQLAGIQHQNRMDEMKYEKGPNADPYPVLAGLYNEGAFKSNPQLEQVVGYHIANRTDPALAGKLLDDIQAAATRPVQQGTLSERRDQRVLKNLRVLRRNKEIPPELMADAKAALQSGNASSAQKVIDQRRKALYSPQGGNWLSDAASLVYQRPEEFASLPADVQSTIKTAVDNNDNMPLRTIMPLLYKNKVGAVQVLLSNSEYRKLRDDNASSKGALRMVQAATDAAAPPNQPGYIDPQLFGPWLGSMSRDNQIRWAMANGYGDDWIKRKQAVWTNASTAMAEFLRSKMGGHASDQDMKLISSSFISGDEPSAQVYNAKVQAIQDFETKRQEALERRMKRMEAAVKSGNIADLSDPASDAELAGLAADLAHTLTSITTNPDLMPDTPLTEEQKAEMGR